MDGQRIDNFFVDSKMMNFQILSQFDNIAVSVKYIDYNYSSHFCFRSDAPVIKATVGKKKKQEKKIIIIITVKKEEVVNFFASTKGSLFNLCHQK